MIGQYVSGAGVIFLLYDVTDVQSFLDLEDWYSVVQKHLLKNTTPETPPEATFVKPALSASAGLKCDGAVGAAAGSAPVPSCSSEADGKPLLFLLGNKVDLPHLRKVSPEQHDQFIRQKKLSGGFLVSARTGENVLTAFYAAVAKAKGMDLTSDELAFTEKVVAASVTAGDGDEGRREGWEDIEKEDRAAESKKGQFCCVIQ
jgi:Ras-related protein Rab-28